MQEEKIKELKESLSRCLKEAVDSIYENQGCEPKDIIGYDGWVEKAENLLSEK